MTPLTDGVGMAAYDRNADRLHDLALTITRDRAVAAQVVADAVVVAAAGKSRWDARTRLYAAVRAEAFDHLTGTGRLPPEDRVVRLASLPPHPTRGDLAALLWQAVAAYGERDQALVTLHLRHRLPTLELAHAMGLSAGSCELLLRDACQRISRGLWALLLLLDPTDTRLAAESREGWDGTFSPFVRRRVAAVAPPTPDGSAEDPLAVLQAVPLVPAPPGLRVTVEHRLDAIGPVAGSLLPAADDLDDTIPPEEAVPLVATAASRATTPGPAVPASTGPPVSGAADAPTEMLPTLPTGARDPGRTSTAVAPGRSWVRSMSLVGLAVVTLALLALATLAARQVLDQREQTAAASTSPVADPTPVSTAPGSPAPSIAAGQLTVPATDVEVTVEEGGAITLGNAGEGAVAFSVVDAPEWLQVDPEEGTIEGGSTGQVDVQLRDGLTEGDYAGPVVFASDVAGADPLAALVTAVVEEPPVLSQVSFGTRDLTTGGCGRDSTEVGVVASDTTGLESVSVIVQGPAPEQQRQVLLAAGEAGAEVFTGVVGPFDAAGTVSVVVQAVDVRGNTATADAGSLEVTGC